MISWILDKVLGIVPFLHGRKKAKEAARAKLLTLQSQLILYALQGNMYAGDFDEELIGWAQKQIASTPKISEREEYSKVKNSLEMILQQPKEFSLAFKLSHSSEQHITKFFPKLDKPSIDEAHLSETDVGLLSELSIKINAINKMSDDIRKLHDKTFDNSLNDYQLNAVRESIDRNYKSISQQSQNAVNKIATMELFK